MKRAIYFVLLFVMEHTSFCQNLVENPGFEKWEKINKPTGWNTVQNCIKDSVNIKSGNYSCLQTGVTGDTKCLGQSLNVVPERQYIFSFYYKTETTGSGHGCRIWCDWKDASGNKITDASAKLVLQPSTYLKSEAWQQFFIEITAPANASSFYLEVRTYQNSIAYWDDFVFEENVATFNPEVLHSEIKIYPNPATNYLIISNIQYLQHIDIQSITGTVQWSSGYSGESTVSIPVSGFADGLYIIRIRTAEKSIIRKFIRKAS